MEQGLGEIEAIRLRAFKGSAGSFVRACRFALRAFPAFRRLRKRSPYWAPVAWFAPAAIAPDPKLSFASLCARRAGTVSTRADPNDVAD